MVMWW